MSQADFRDAFSMFVSETKSTLMDYYDKAATHHNEREIIVELSRALFQLDSLLKNQPTPTEDI